MNYDSGVVYTTVTIASGQSLSPVAGIDMVRRKIVGFIFPSNIDSATALTFQTSAGSANQGTPNPTAPAVSGDWGNAYDSNGTEINLTVAASRNVKLTGTHAALAMEFPRYVRIRLGTAGSPTAATADRTIGILSREL